MEWKGKSYCFFQSIILSSGSFKSKLEVCGWRENSFRRTRFLPIFLNVRFCFGALSWLNDFCTTLRNAFWFTSALIFFSRSIFSKFSSERKSLADWVLMTDALILLGLKKWAFKKNTNKIFCQTHLLKYFVDFLGFLTRFLHKRMICRIFLFRSDQTLPGCNWRKSNAWMMIVTSVEIK